MKHSIFYIYFKTVYFRMLLPMTNTFPLRNVCFYFMARLLQIFMLTCPEIAFPKFYEPLHLLQKRDPNKIFFSSLLKFSFKINGEISSPSYFLPEGQLQIPFPRGGSASLLYIVLPHHSHVRHTD